MQPPNHKQMGRVPNAMPEIAERSEANCSMPQHVEIVAARPNIIVQLGTRALR